MKKVILIFIFAFLAACNSQDKRPLIGDSAFQQKLNALFKDATKSPLKKSDLKNFKGLDFFPVDSSYIVNAVLQRTPDSPYVEMATTDDRKPYYREYGGLYFTLKGKKFNLTLYQSLEESQDPTYNDYLFLPFTDLTSGEESYGGGRYMNVFRSSITSDDTIELNFNNTYNPYCTYDEEYSCPITPRKNHLPIAIKAGIKNFKRK